jgi:tetratricopeptide (TPR) repeat protein
MTLASSPNDQTSATPSFVGQTVVFTGRLASVGHRVARELVERLGGLAADEITSRTTMLVIGAEGSARPLSVARDAEKSNKLKRAEALNTRTPGCIQILTEEEFCRMGSLRSNESLRQRYHSLRQIRGLYPLMNENRLRDLEKWGLIRPVVRTNADTYYSFTDVSVIKQVSDELVEGRSFRGAVRRRLAALEGQLALNFGSVHSDARPAKVVALRRREATKILAPSNGTWSASDSAQNALAARFFVEGAELDEGGEGERERARIAYRKALLLDPNLVPAIVNLANLHYANDDLVEAQALYSRALMLDTDCFEAHFNLGNIHHDLGRYQEAVAYYHDALRLNVGYADAHFYLAVTLEKMGQSESAKTHWRAYQQLAPDGEWVDLAREFSE